MITAVIPIRQTEEHSRSWDRLEIGISSLKRFVPSVTSIFVVDSNSDEPWATELVDICERLDVHLWRIDDLDHWNKCKTMNAAMYQAVTPYVMQFDVDMVITTDEVEKAIQAQLEPNIFLTFLIHNLCHQLTCDRVIEEDADKLHEWMKSHSLLRAGGRSTGGIQIFDRTWFLKVRGYDEEYALWGREDDDMVKRAKLDGLTHLHDRTLVFHIGHKNPIKTKDQMKANEIRYKTTETVVRNDEEWGSVPIRKLV